MAQLLDHVEYLTKEVGARPAGTEEEHQAALYITEQFQKEARFTAAIEEFATKSNFTWLRPVCAGIVIVFAILAMLFPVLAVPAFILAVAATVVYVLDGLEIMDISRLLARGASQNVVAKYQPNPEAANASSRRARSRKIVLVAHYDSGKVTPALVKRVESMGLPLGLICMCAMAFSAFLLLIRIFAGSADGIGGVLLNIITILALIVVALPVVKAIMLTLAPYNEGANNNATGVAALLEVARRISNGSMSEADIADAEDNVTIHGLEEALASGYVPEGAQINYDMETPAMPEEEPVPAPVIEPLDDEERLLAAKAALAAFTGQPIERRVYGSVASNLVNSRASDTSEHVSPSYEPSVPQAQGEKVDAERPVRAEQPIEVTQTTVANVAAAIASEAAVEEEETVEGFENAPDWFVAAQQKAKRTSPALSGPVQRSRYTDAIEAAEREAAERERAREEAARAQREEEFKTAQTSLLSSVQPQDVQEEAQPEIEFEPIPEFAAQEEGGWSTFNNMSAAQPIPVITPIVEEVVEQPLEEEELSGETQALPADWLSAQVEEKLSPVEAEEEPAPVEVEALEDAPTNAEEPEFEQEEAGYLEDSEDEEAEPPAQFEDDDNSPSLSSMIPRIEEPAATVQEQDSDVPVRANRRRIEALPAIDSQPQRQAKPEVASPSRSGMFRKLRADVPSMSGVIRLQEAGEDVSQNPADYQVRRRVAQSLPNTAEILEAPQVIAGPSVAPVVQDEPADDYYDMPLDYEDDYEQYEDEPIDEPVDSLVEEAPVTPRQRKTRNSQEKRGLFDRFRRKEKDLSDTPQEWLDVDDDFEARAVGKKRGGWESFRDDFEDDQYADFDEEEGGSNRWEGGAFSRLRLGHVDMHSGEGADADEPEASTEEEADRVLNKEIEQIYHFRNPSYNTEIWFVAVGAEVELNDGARAFLNEHADDLRGAMIIEVESLGMGELCAASDEGLFRKIKASSRVKRYTRSATAATGVNIGSVSLAGSDSLASLAQKGGFQSMHLLGVEDGSPALKGSVDDVLENIDEEILEENVDFLMELLKHN